MRRHVKNAKDEGRWLISGEFAAIASPRSLPSMTSLLRADNSDLDFVDIIENECERLENTLDQERLDELGESLVTSSGDLNQMRAQLHVRRIKDLVWTGS